MSRFVTVLNLGNGICARREMLMAVRACETIRRSPKGKPDYQSAWIEEVETHSRNDLDQEICRAAAIFTTHMLKEERRIFAVTTSSVRAFLVHLALGLIPPTRAYALKRALFRWVGVKIGADVMIVSSTRIMVSGAVAIGSNTFLGHECFFVGGDAPIRVGANVSIGPRVILVTGTHHIQPGAASVAGKGFSVPISIGDGCWICAGATILGGTTIGPGAIVAAGAVVKGNFPGHCLIAGVPARVVRGSLEANQGNA